MESLHSVEPVSIPTVINVKWHVTEKSSGALLRVKCVCVENYRENWVPFRPLTGPTMCPFCRIRPHQFGIVDGCTKWYNLNRIELNLVATSPRRLRIIWFFFLRSFEQPRDVETGKERVQMRCQTTPTNIQEKKIAKLPYVPAANTFVDLRRNFWPQKCSHLCVCVYLVARNISI